MDDPVYPIEYTAPAGVTLLKARQSQADTAVDSAGAEAGAMPPYPSKKLTLKDGQYIAADHEI